MAASTVDSLNGRAADLLAAVATALAATDAKAPGRQFVSPGLPAFDCCPFIAVNTVLLGLADTSPLSPALQPALRAQGSSVNLVTLNAYVVRCVPGSATDGTPPSPAALTAAGAAVNQDGWAVWNHLKRAVREQTLFPGCNTAVFFDGGVALDPAGGCAGWLFTVRVELPGIPAA